MTMTATSTASVPPISHREAHGLALDAYRQFAADVARLGPGDWARPTDCEGWTVRHLVGHMVGAMRAAASLRELLRQQAEIKKRVKATGGNETDVMTALQIEMLAGASTAELVAECTDIAARAAAGRRRIPAPMRRFVTFPVEVGSATETWRLGYLVDVILTRDAWMHRIDLSRAVGSDLTLTAAHDGRIVADVVAEWARRHGRPFRLSLTGPAGGSFANGPAAGAEVLELDAVEFCRLVSGRGAGRGLLTTEVPF
ncbi:maleylpyruvate isomerase family mycothiol-dependent enzyme [Nocardioides dilutus]